MELEELQKRATEAGETGIRAQHILSDMNLVLSQLNHEQSAIAAVQTLQKWADEPGEGGLRKAVAGAFLARARAALGHPHSRPLAGGNAHVVQPGHQHAMSQGVADRFAHRPQPRVQQEMQPSPRLEAPQPTVHAATLSAHTSGSRLAALSAHHGFKLGLAAGAAGGVAGAMAGKGKKKEHQEPAEKAADGGDLEKWKAHWDSGIHGLLYSAGLVNSRRQNAAANRVPKPPKSTCPTCGQPTQPGMTKCDGGHDLQKLPSLDDLAKAEAMAAAGKILSGSGAPTNSSPLNLLSIKGTPAKMLNQVADTAVAHTPNKGSGPLADGTQGPAGAGAPNMAGKGMSGTGAPTNSSPLNQQDLRGNPTKMMNQVADTPVSRQAAAKSRWTKMIGDLAARKKAKAKSAA